MTSDYRPGLQPLSHLKAGPTTSSSRSTASPASSTTQQSSNAPNRPRFRKNISRDDFADATSEKATTALIRRVLCPQAGNYGVSAQQSPEELLPPLTSSNDVDRQLYALVAIIVKEFVYSWYSRITSDQALVNEVLQVIAHCTRALEQRLRQVDVAQLVLDEIPALVETHVISYRLAKQQTNLSGLPTSTRTIYHTLNPHPALSPVPEPSDPIAVVEQDENEDVYRQLLVHGMLAVLLPTEDLENACLRTLVGDVLADLLMGNEVSRRVCEGWFIWESISKLLDTVEQKGPETNKEAGQQDRLKTFGLLTKEEPRGHVPPKSQSRVAAWIWMFLHGAYLTYVAFRFIASGLLHVTSSQSSRSTPAGPISYGSEAPKSAGNVTGKRPVLDYRLYSMISQLIDVPRRMPWLTGMLALMQYMILAGPGRVGDTGSVLDRFLHQTINTQILTPALLPNLLRAARAGLFPGNARPRDRERDRGQALVGGAGGGVPGVVGGPNSSSPHPVSGSPSTSTPTQLPSAPLPAKSNSPPQPQPLSSDSDAIRRRCAVRIASFIPGIARGLFFDSVESPQASTPGTGSDDDNNDGADDDEDRYVRNIDDLLDLFADEYCNKHLVYAIIETVLVRVLPELGERSVRELMEDRGVST